MALIEKEIVSLQANIDWWEDDIEEMEQMLTYAGKGKEGKYEHYLLTMTLVSLQEAKEYCQRIVDSYPNKIDKASSKRDTKALPETSEQTLKEHEEATAKQIKKEEELKKLIDIVVSEHPDEFKLAQEGRDGMIGALTAFAVSKISNPSKTSVNSILKGLNDKLSSQA